MNPTTGEHFGPYEILGTLGRGGVGEVYRAWDSRLEREVALKLLHDDYPQHSNRERFMIEARAASALSHPNICTIFDIGFKEGAPYLVMELLRGETLKHRIERGGMPSEEIAQFGMEIADALASAHELGIVHRDIKPANVVLVRLPDGRARVKVLDFGLAKLTAILPGNLVHHDEHLTVVGEAVGTVSYMSPEQARGEELDHRSDLFSLGVVMYEMATRRTPFQGSTTALLFDRLLHDEPEPIREWNESVPRPLEKIIFRLLEKDPARRFQRASDASAALASHCGKTSGSRWRRATSAPAVPLVRVEEPVARAGLPIRPDLRRDGAVIGLGLATPASGDRPAAIRSTSDAVHVRPASVHDHRPASQTPVRPTASHAEQRVEIPQQHYVEAARRSSELHTPAGRLFLRETPSAAVQPAATVQPAETHYEPAARVEARPVELAPEPQFHRASEAHISVVPETPSHHATAFAEPTAVSRHEAIPEAVLHSEPVQERLASREQLASKELVREPDHRDSAHLDAPRSNSAHHEPEAVRAPYPKPVSPESAAEIVQLQPMSWAGGHFLRVADKAETASGSHDEYATRRRARIVRKRRRVAAIAGAAAVVIAAASFGVRALLNQPGPIGADRRLLVTAIENHTGVQTLDGSVAQGLEFALAQDPAFAIRGVNSYRQGLHVMGADESQPNLTLAHQAAQAAGAAAYLYGELRDAEEGAHSSGAGYTLSVRILETAGNRELAHAEARAARTEEVPNAIDEVVGRLRTELKLPQDASGSPLPLAKEATNSLNALHSYSVGVEAEAEGRTTAALKAFALAASADPNFVQAQLRDAELSFEQDAFTASAHAAGRAVSSATNRSARTVLLAQIASALNGGTDLHAAEAAAQKLLAADPHDPAGQLAMVRILRAQGRFADALQLAQRAAAAAPSDLDLAHETELSLIALDRYPAAVAMEAKSPASPGVALLSAYLAGQEDRVSAATAATNGASADIASQAAHAQYLDSVGELNEAAGIWRDLFSTTRRQPAMAGAGSALLANAALDRAFIGQCGAALDFAQVAGADPANGATEIEQTGIAQALCGNPAAASRALAALAQVSPEGIAASELRAAIDIGRGSPKDAVTELANLPAPEAAPIALYLRGIARTGSRDAAGAVTDLQELVAHRGVVSLTGTNLYPAAQIALARALAASGDRAGSSHTYAQFLHLWDGAASSDHLRAEASLGVRGILPRVISPVAPVADSADEADAAASGEPATVAEKRPLTAAEKAADPQNYPDEHRYPQKARSSDIE